ncbi:MAG: alpha-2-macroglobulin, partial [Bradymonadaceae bacterium]
IRPTEKLPYDATVTFRLREGAPSAEGPKPAPSEDTFQFTTYGPFEIDRNVCARRTVRPTGPMSLSFTNPIDEDSFEAEDLEISPEIEGLSVTVRNYGHGALWIRGEKKGRQTYEVTFPESMTDEYGQQLDGDRTVECEVDAARADLSVPAGASNRWMTVLDPSGKPTLTVHSINYKTLRVRAFEVEPSDWGDYLEFYRGRYRHRRPVDPPGSGAFWRTVTVDGPVEERVKTEVDLREALGPNGHGNVVVEIKPGRTMPGAEEPNFEPPIRRWVQSTDLGLDVSVDGDELVGWATDLTTGEPQLTIGASGRQKQTDDSGLARIALPDASQLETDLEYDFAQVKKDGSTAFLPSTRYNSLERDAQLWTARDENPGSIWYTFDDRGMYRPGGTVHLKGWLRGRAASELGGLRAVDALEAVKWTVEGPRGNEWAQGTATPSKLGGFDIEFDVPEEANLGRATVELVAQGDLEGNYNKGRHTFQVQEFRKPKFEVDVTGGEEPYVAGESSTFEVSASYYSGGPLSKADVDWKVSRKPGTYTPPDQSEFQFGRQRPYWAGRVGYLRRATRSIDAFAAQTDAAGRHRLAVAFGQPSPPLPMNVTVAAAVTGDDNQQWSGTSSMVVHPSRYYVGLKTDRYFVGRDESLAVEAIVTDIDGNHRAGRPIKVRAYRVETDWEDGEYNEELVDPQTCSVVSKQEPVDCRFDPNTGGRYKIRATTVDDRGRHNFSEIRRFVAGGSRPRARSVEREHVGLVPSRETYRPGDEAELLVRSPIVPAEALMTVRRNGIIETRRFRMEEPTETITVDIKEGYVPNVHVQVDLVGSQPRLDGDGEPDESLPERPAFGLGEVNLEVSPRDRELDVRVSPESDALAPSSETSVDVHVENAAGEPVEGAEVAVVAADEAVLALSDYEMPDPLEVFYATQFEGTEDYRLRSKIHLAEAEDLEPKGRKKRKKRRLRPKKKRHNRKRKKGGSGSGGGGDGFGRVHGLGALQAESGETEADRSVGGGAFNKTVALGAMASASRSLDRVGSRQKAIDVRDDFGSLVLFEPEAHTDANGDVSLDVELPDNLTRYRLTAVAVDGTRRVGSDDHSMTVRKPLTVRPSAPRFLNYGDTARIPAVLHNQTDQPETVRVAARATNLEMTDAAGYTVEVPADGRKRVRFDVATHRPGTARLQVVAASGAGSDAAELEFPVWTPATSEAFATYGTLDEDRQTAGLTVEKPPDARVEFGGLEVTTSSTALQALTDAFLYLYDHDYDGVEQISSRMVSVAALQDVLRAFEADGMPDREEVDSAMARDIDHLAGRQNDDGGFPLWRTDGRSWPFVSLHAIHALVRADQKGYDVPASVLENGRSYLRGIDGEIPDAYSKRTQRFVVAYSLYVRDLMGETDAARARRMIRRADSLEALPLEAVGWLMDVLAGSGGSRAYVAKLERYLNNRVQQTAGTANFAADYDNRDQEHLIMHAKRRADAVVLRALIEARPDSELIPKLARGLLAHRKKGRWSNTQDNAFVLLALDRYFREYEDQTPDFVARAWLGDRYAGEHTFEGRSTERHHIDVPMRQLAAVDDESEGAPTLRLQKDGDGRMYYRVGLEYAPDDLDLDAADHGFVVERSYEPVDGDGTVERRDDGTLVVEKGARVKVRLRMVAPIRRYHVALVDSLPAGFEPLNPELATTGPLPEEQSTRTRRPMVSFCHGLWRDRPWYEHENMRDERVEAFASMVDGGVYTYTYYARATTAGEFIVPPARAEEMYHPETFGRTATERVVVE